MHCTADPKFAPKVCGPHLNKMQHTVPKHLFFPFGGWQAADVWASYARSLEHRDLHVLSHKPAKALFTSQGSQDLVKLLPHCGSFTLRPCYQMQVTVHHLYFTSDVFQAFFRFQVVRNKWQLAKSVFLLTSTKIKQDLINQCFTGRQVTCSKDCAVDLNERCKLRELLR